MWRKYLGKYNDILLGLVLIPVINTINYHLTYAVIRWDWYTAATYSIDTVSGYISWWIIRVIVIRLDRRMPYEKGFARRMLVQLGLTNAAVLGFTILATEGVNALYTDKPLPIHFYTYNLFIFFIWILVINGIYTGIYFYDQWKRSQRDRELDRELRLNGFQVRQGKRVITLPFDKLLAFFSEDGQTYLLADQGRRYAADQSLGKVVALLPPELFFRVNRSCILSRDLISGYRRLDHGKLELELEQPGILSEAPVVSRLTAPEFKAWLEADVQKA